MNRFSSTVDDYVCLVLTFFVSNKTDLSQSVYVRV